MNIKDYPARLTSGYYRVRETWDDAASQLGAFRLLANAMAKADANPGYFVFSNEGEAIYPEPESGMEETEELSGTQSPVEDSMEGQVDTPLGGNNSGGNKESAETGERAEHTEAVPENPEGTVDPSGSVPAEEETGQGIDGAEKEFPEAVEYDYDGNDTPIAYAKLKTLMNIRDGNSLDAESLTTYRKGTVVEVLQVCGDGWLRIRCPESDTGFAYVCGNAMYIHGLGKKLYTVSPKDNLWRIAEEQIGDGTRYTEIRELNGLTCNVIRVGMQLVLP
jgi:N-acetylmuramoyl-L-alanine amidase